MRDLIRLCSSYYIQVGPKIRHKFSNTPSPPFPTCNHKTPSRPYLAVYFSPRAIHNASISYRRNIPRTILFFSIDFSIRSAESLSPKTEGRQFVRTKEPRWSLPLKTGFPIRLPSTLGRLMDRIIRWEWKFMSFGDLSLRGLAFGVPENPWNSDALVKPPDKWVSLPVQRKRYPPPSAITVRQISLIPRGDAVPIVGGTNGQLVINTEIRVVLRFGIFFFTP